MTIRFDDKVAIVTGAGGGLGRQHALEFARRGAKVVVNDLGGALDGSGGASDAANTVVEEIKAEGGEAIANGSSVSDRPGVAKMVADTMEKWGRIDILVNNAGIAIRKSIFEMTMDEYQLQNSINLDGVFMGLKYGIPMIAKTEGGSVINLSSVAGLKASPGLSAYAMTKGGVRLLSKSVAKECIAEGINVRVNSVHPGIIQTAIWDKMGVPTDGENQVDVEQLANNAVPGGLLGKPTDIADGVLFLASDESRYVNGSELVIDHAISA